jgi:signal transduction histidine kinase
MKFLSYGVMVYMLMALIWWTILLSRNNNMLYQKNLALISMAQANDGNLPAFIPITLSKASVQKEYLRNKYMILGEGLVFGLSLIMGLWFIQKAYTKERENNIHQKNFLLSVTHELKSPIAAINLITQTLLKRKLPQDSIDNLHASVLSESSRLENLINNLLLATRLNNAYQYHFDLFDMCELAEKIIKSLHLQYHDSNISTNFSEKPMLIKADKESIISVITNLIENAIKYSPEQPQIALKINKTNKQCQIIVSDLGIGIPEVEKEKVIRQFYRIGNEETRKTKGTGLGLYIANKIVKAHQGKLKITDNIPTGTIITVTLPSNT